MEEFSGFVKRLSREYKLPVVNIRLNMLHTLEERNIENMPHSVVTYDGVHLNEIGHLAVAQELLDGLGLKNHSVVVPEDPNVEVRRRQSTMLEHFDFDAGVEIEAGNEFLL